MTYHFVVGDLAAKPLSEALIQDDTTDAAIIILKDILNVGPIKKDEGQSFDEMRSTFWQAVLPFEKTSPAVNDMERLLEVSKKMYDDDTIQAWFWMAPLAADVCAYHWLLPYLSKHVSRFFIINIAGLPFLNESGKLFFPQSIADIPTKEIIKAKKLARIVTPSEIEVDNYEWKKLQQENDGMRTHGGGKKLVSQNENYYDHILLDYCNDQFQKASKIINQAITKQNIATGDLYLAWRLRKMTEQGRLALQGDVTKSLKDFEVKLPDTNSIS
jgi:hypothetical protein